MMTFNQLLKCVRKEKKRKIRSPRMEKKPQRKCICMKITTVKPKKPNSAIRKIAKVALVNKFRVIKKQRFTIAYIPGIGHNLRQHSVILLRGGRVPDLPGVKYHIIRGKYDFTGIEKFVRSTRRSKFSIKNLKKI